MRLTLAGVGHIVMLVVARGIRRGWRRRGFVGDSDASSTRLRSAGAEERARAMTAPGGKHYGRRQLGVRAPAPTRRSVTAPAPAGEDHGEAPADDADEDVGRPSPASHTEHG